MFPTAFLAVLLALFGGEGAEAAFDVPFGVVVDRLIVGLCLLCLLADGRDNDGCIADFGWWEGFAAFEEVHGFPAMLLGCWS